MKLKKLFKYYVLGESLKEIEACRILQKVCKKKKLTKKEKDFINLYNDTAKKIDKVVVTDDKDYMLLSKSVVSVKIKDILNVGRKIICNLHDRDGKIGLYIIDVVNDFNEDHSFVLMEGDKKHQLFDKFLYNLIFNNKKNEYFLEEHDEYFEKIEAE